MKERPYNLFLELGYPSGAKIWYYWKNYKTPSAAEQAAKQLYENFKDPFGPGLGFTGRAKVENRGLATDLLFYHTSYYDFREKANDT